MTAILEDPPWSRDSGNDFDLFSFPFLICQISTPSEMAREKQRKIEQKQTGSNAILGTQKLFPLSLPWMQIFSSSCF